MKKLISLACLAALAAPSHAQDVVPASNLTPRSDEGRPAVAGDGKLKQIEIPGSRANDTDLRRMSTASKLIYGREELDRNGDTTLGEILKRLPGVVMGGRPGRGGAVRMRGMGSGYTQMLVNGERPPPGFSFESLSPDQVERIEVIRGTVAEHSTQAIAGTINIVLREGYQQKSSEIKLSDTVEQERHRPNVSLTIPGKAGDLSWLLNASVFANRQHDASNTTILDERADGTLEHDQRVTDTSDRHSTGVHLSSRVSYRFDNGDLLNFQPFLVSSRSSGSGETDVDQLAGILAPVYARQDSDTNSSSTFLRGFGNWTHRTQGGGKIDVKFGFGSGHTDSATLRNTFDAAGAPLKSYVDTDATKDHSLNTGGKYSAPLGQGHQLAAGWEVETSHRVQEHVALDDGTAEFDDSGASLTADTRRFAGFVQDEWDITPQWAVNLGLRWEGIRTTSTASANDVSNTSRVWSPVFHVVYRIPGHAKDQVRFSATHSYRAPALNDLIATPSFSTDNSQIRPDRMGNPNLKPELAKGLDFAYEHYLGRSGILSAGGFLRDIDNLMRRQTIQLASDGNRWVSTPINIDHARTSGVELEAKFQLVELMPDAPNIDFRSNYSHFWSRVDGIQGPNNTIDQQPTQTANLGVDYRMKALPLTLGANYNWTPAIAVQTSATEFVSTGVKR
ncbi:MAG TPA: TonB-dependent receptor, partial [Telluria sp.]|nr:TonB-dependent receptor [Telluria sp.]